MSELDMAMVRQLIPNWDSLPNMLSPKDAAPIVGWQKSTLDQNRCKHRHSIGYVKSGRSILYPKTELARHLLRGVVGVGESV